MHHVLSERLQPIFRQFVNLIKHCATERYSRYDTNNHMLSEEKNVSILISSQFITLLLYLLISSQIDDATMGSSLGPTLANAFWIYHKKMARTLSTKT